MSKVQSVLELSRYKIGDIAWWVVLRHKKIIKDPVIDEWMLNSHPKSLYERGPFRSMWQGNTQLPKLHSIDFALITNMVTQKFETEEFHVNSIRRSTDTGEYYYSNENKEWMPESYLFDSNVAANVEKARLTRMIKKWADT